MISTILSDSAGGTLRLVDLVEAAPVQEVIAAENRLQRVCETKAGMPISLEVSESFVKRTSPCSRLHFSYSAGVDPSLA